jgi:hypothetical protein
MLLSRKRERLGEGVPTDRSPVLVMTVGALT